MEGCNHNERRKVSHGLCDPCYRSMLKQTKPEYAALCRRSRQNWKKANPEKLKAQRRLYDIRRRARLGGPAFNATKRHRMSHDEYLALVERSGGICGICQKKARLYIDHDHNTDVIRGMLCNSCNAGMGALGDSVDGLMAAVRYLSQESHP